VPDTDSCGCARPNTFDRRSAERDLERYLDKGPDATTRALIDAIIAEGIDGATVLDIGGGIGAIQLELLASGAASAVSVDASEAYSEVSSGEVARRGLADRATAHVGDFVQLAPDIEPADVVTLDRVVCCYSDLPALIDSTTSHARRLIGLVYPRPAWWNRIAARILDAYGWLTRDPTRWYLHRPGQLDELLRAAGFTGREVRRSLVWQVALYSRAR
jgi:magnesium-protoporphyrin O-methyltransferase